MFLQIGVLSLVLSLAGGDLIRFVFCQLGRNINDSHLSDRTEEFKPSVFTENNDQDHFYNYTNRRLTKYFFINFIQVEETK